MMRVLLSEETCRKSSRLAETSKSALSVNQRGRPVNRKRKRIENPSPNRGVLGLGGVLKRGIFRRTTSRRRMEKAKERRMTSHISQRVMDLMS